MNHLTDPGRYSPWLEPARRQARQAIMRLPAPLAEFLVFGFKQGWACLFGGLMLALIIASKYLWQAGWTPTRYDFLFLSAIAIQIIFLLTKLETWEEMKVIFIFHIVGTIMEIFKTHVGSWIYPEENFFRIGGVPLFSGFMYGCVGSYLARVWRIFDFRFTRYPPIWQTALLSAAIYINFFTHHYWYDLRYIIFAVTALLYARTWVHYTPFQMDLKMPLLLGFVLVALFIWFAENIGTFTGTWLYPNQREWQMVSIGKMGAWFLLMIISFVLVSLVQKPQPAQAA